MFEVEELLTFVTNNEFISDLHLTPNRHPLIRRNGDIKPVKQFGDELTPSRVEEIALELMNDEQKKEFEAKGEIDFSFSISGKGRFRANIYRQRHSVGVALRVLSSDIKSIDELGLPPVINNLTQKNHGLILCTGPTGSGKSTTLAAMIDLINRERECHILTLEDPIEYLHNHKKAIVHQREIGVDTKSFATGLRAALRQDPDIILVGEMRDLEVIKTAVEASETGHLVMATLHTNDASQSMDRIIDVFPPHQQEQIRMQLALVIEGVISQQLIPRADKPGMVPAVEIMLGTSAIRNLIRENKTHQIYSVIQTGGRHEMQTIDMHLTQLCKEQKITREEAMKRASNPDYIKRRLLGRS